MARFGFQVYYYYNGPTKGDPLGRRQKSDERIADALREFPRQLAHFLSDNKAAISEDESRRSPWSIVVTVEASTPQDKVKKEVAAALDSFDLFGADPRQRVSKDFLNEKIKAAAVALEACKDVDPSTVYWHQPDESGCNWNVGVFTGHGAPALPCAHEIRPAIDRLRTQYDIEDERE